MVLKIPGGNPLKTTSTSINKAVAIPKEKEINVGRINGILVPISIGLGIDCGAAAYIINCVAYGAGEKAVGFLTTRTIHNQTGAADNYDYAITNVTQGTTLSSTTAHTLADGEFTVVTQFWTLAQIAPGDYVRFTVSDGIIGTNAGRATLGTVSFFVESVDEAIIS